MNPGEADDTPLAGRQPAPQRAAIEPPPLALSSMWHQRFADPADLRPFLDAGRQMGFRCFELSHDVPPEAIEPLIAAGSSIASVHHACPRPADLDARDHACHPDADRRARFVTGMRRTIDTAESLDATAVVLHLGRFEDDGLRRAAFEVSSRFRARQTDGPAFVAALDRLRDARDRAEGASIEGARTALSEVADYAAGRAIRVGLETGYHPWESPSPAGMANLLDGLGADGDGLGAWLDTGHAAARAAIGLDPLADWHAAVGGRWVGAHFHDLVGLRDHLAPGAGNLDFAAFAAWLPPQALRTLEVDWYLSPGEVRAGADHLARCGCASSLRSG